MEAQVLQHEQSAPGQRRDLRLDGGADAVRRENDGSVQRARQVVAHGKKAILRLYLAVRPAQVRCDHDLLRALRDEMDRRHSAVDSMRLGDLALLDRHVEVDANEDGFTLQLQIGELSNHVVVSDYLFTGIMFSID